MNHTQKWFINIEGSYFKEKFKVKNTMKLKIEWKILLILNQYIYSSCYS